MSYTDSVVALGSSVNITSTIKNGSFVCQGQELNFTCEVPGSILTWISSGQHRLQLTSRTTIGQTIPSQTDNNVTAMRLNKEGEGVKSQLSVKVTSSSAITCSNTDDSSSNTITFKALGKLEGNGSSL